MARQSFKGRRQAATFMGVFTHFINELRRNAWYAKMIAEGMKKNDGNGGFITDSRGRLAELTFIVDEGELQVINVKFTASTLGVLCWSDCIVYGSSAEGTDGSVDFEMSDKLFKEVHAALFEECRQFFTRHGIQLSNSPSGRFFKAGA